MQILMALDSTFETVVLLLNRAVLASPITLSIYKWLGHYAAIAEYGAVGMVSSSDYRFQVGAENRKASTFKLQAD